MKYSSRYRAALKLSSEFNFLCLKLEFVLCLSRKVRKIFIFETQRKSELGRIRSWVKEFNFVSSYKGKLGPEKKVDERKVFAIHVKKFNNFLGTDTLCEKPPHGILKNFPELFTENFIKGAAYAKVSIKHLIIENST